MNPEDKRQELLSASETVIADGIDFWANDRPGDGTNKLVTGRQEQHQQIMRDREEYRNLYRSSSSKFGEIVAKPVRDDDYETMAGAILYLAAAGYEDKGPRSDLIGDSYDQKAPRVAQFVCELNNYSALDQYSVSQIVTRIENGEKELYQLLKREVIATRDGIKDLNVPEAALENDQEISFLQRILKQRQEKMTQAVQEYAGKNTLYEILQDLEEAILTTGEATQTREEIIEAIEAEIADLEDNISVTLRNQREQFTADIKSITANLEAELLTSSEFKDELTSLEEQLQWALREHREQLLTELQRQSDENLDQLTPEGMIGLLSEQRNDIVESIERHLIQSQNQIEGRLDDLTDKQHQLNQAIRQVEESREQVSQSEIESLIQSELTQLTDQRDQLDTLIDRFERERERLEAEVESLDNAPTPPEPVTQGSSEISGSNIVPASVARLYEDDFIARIERSVRDATDISMSDGSHLELETSYWKQQSRSEQGSFQGSIVADLPEEAQIRRYPERPWTRFATIESTGILGQSQETELVIEGVTVTRLPVYAEHGYDWAPATLAELHDVVGEALDRSLVRGQEEADHLLIVGSPTGWSDRVLDEIGSGSLFGADVSVCLTDLQTNATHYYNHDSLLSNNEWLLSPALTEEQIPEVAQTIRSEYAKNPNCERVLLLTIAETHGYDEHIIKLAFNRLEEKGIGEQIETSRGLLLSFNPA